MFGIPKCTLIYDIPWITSFEWPNDDSLESKHVAVSIILYNKLLCLTETYILYEFDKHIGMTTVKAIYSYVCVCVCVCVCVYIYTHIYAYIYINVIFSSQPGLPEPS